MPSPKHPTKTTTTTIQAELTQTHQRLRVSIRSEPAALLAITSVETERSNPGDDGTRESDGASSVGFTNNVPKEHRWRS